MAGFRMQEATPIYPWLNFLASPRQAHAARAGEPLATAKAPRRALQRYIDLAQRQEKLLMSR
jgi:hypothetical protein